MFNELHMEEDWKKDNKNLSYFPSTNLLVTPIAQLEMNQVETVLTRDSTLLDPTWSFWNTYVDLQYLLSTVRMPRVSEDE